MSRLRRSPNAKTKNRLEAGPTKRPRHSGCCPESSMPSATMEGGDLKSPLQRRGELAGGEIFQGAKASVEFGGRQAPQAVEGAQKIPGRPVTLARVAFDTAGNQVAVGIASEAHAGHKVMQFLSAGRNIGVVVDGKVTLYGGKKANEPVSRKKQGREERE